MATKVVSATVDAAVAEKPDRPAATTNLKKSYCVNAAGSTVRSPSTPWSWSVACSCRTPVRGRP